MVSWKDLIPLPDFGNLLQGLLPDDELPYHKFYRGVGIRIMAAGLIGFFLFWALAIVIDEAFFTLSQISGVIGIIGLFVLAIFYFLGSAHRRLDREEREADIEKTLAGANRTNALAEQIRASNSQRSTFRERQERRMIEADESVQNTDSTTVESIERS